MKLRMLVRVLLKLLGLFFIVEGVASATSAIVYGAMIFADETTYVGASTLASPASRFAWSALTLLLGLYLFFGPSNVVARIMQGTGPHCHACGYDLSGVSGEQCAECGARRGDAGSS